MSYYSHFLMNEEQKYFTFVYGHAVAQWLGHCATSRKVAGSRPDEVNEFFQFT
jgi:hypothetical protein